MSNITRRTFLALAVVVAGFLALGANRVAAAGPHHPTGAIQGTVTNPQGHPAAGAHVTLVNVNHHVVATTAANKHGAFHFPHVIPGHYTVRAAGVHKTDGSAGVDVHAGHTAIVHIALH